MVALFVYEATAKVDTLNVRLNIHWTNHYANGAAPQEPLVSKLSLSIMLKVPQVRVNERDKVSTSYNLFSFVADNVTRLG